MKLNIGQGRTRNTLNVVTLDHAGWKHIDVCPTYEPDECYDVTGGIREPDASVESIWMGDVLEHMPRAKVGFVLSECARVLQPGGTLLVAVPDMAAVLSRWLEQGGIEKPDEMPLTWLIWGEQDESGGGANAEPDTHRHGFTEASLAAALTGAGFVSAERTTVHGVWYELAMRATKGAA